MRMMCGRVATLDLVRQDGGFRHPDARADAKELEKYLY